MSERLPLERAVTAYYKAVRPDGRDFHTGTIDYAAALASGEVVRHPKKRKVRDDPSTYLSVSVSAADCTGFRWPCRLFRVEPVGPVMANLSASPSKRAMSALCVIEELPAWRAFGPNGEAVVRLIETAGGLTNDQVEKLAARYAARYAARDATWDAARDATWYAAWDAARYAARAAWDATRYAAGDAAGNAAWDATWAAAGNAAWAAARGAAWALVVRDLISAEHFDALTKPWCDAGLPL